MKSHRNRFYGGWRLVAIAFCAAACGATWGATNEVVKSKNFAKSKTEAAKVLKKVKDKNQAPGGSAPTLGEGFAAYSLSTRDIKNYQPGQDPAKLLQPVEKFFYPVKSGTNIVSGISVQKTDGAWQSLVGADDLVRTLSAAHKSTAPGRAANDQSSFLVQMRSLNHKFLGFKGTNGALMLRPLNEDKTLGLSTNLNYQANEVFARLAPLASNYNGLPR